MATVNYKGVITGDAVWVRNGPNISCGTVRLLYRGEEITATEQQGDWIKHNKGGWSCLKHTDGTSIINITDLGSSSKPVTNSDSGDKEKTLEESYYAQFNYDSVEPSGGEHSKLMMQSVRGIYGMPYQYMSSVDRKLPDSMYGRKFASKIVSRMPMLLLTPGKAKFMKGYSDNEKGDLLKNLIIGSDKSVVDELLNDKDGKFYTFEFNYKEYYAIVNPMLQRISRFINIQDEKLDGKSLDKYEWENYPNNALGMISNKSCVAFYIDSDTQISESFSNATGESMLSDKVNSLSDMGREVQFLLGGTAGIEFDGLKQENYDASLKEFKTFTDKYSAILPKQLMSKLTSGFLTVATGGKMIFPEIYNDSDFGRSYDITVKLTTPDGDLYSWYMNIVVPLIHLIALVGPQQLGANGYKSPFLIRGYYKGFFNVDMGIITSMTINKGDKEKWTLNGLPTEVEVNFTIKDLYQILTLTPDNKVKDILNNTALMDYLANLCGININKPDIKRSLDLYFNQITNSLYDKVTFDGFLGVEQWVSNMANSIFKRGR